MRDSLAALLIVLIFNCVPARSEPLSGEIHKTDFGSNDTVLQPTTTPSWFGVAEPISQQPQASKSAWFGVPSVPVSQPLPAQRAMQMQSSIEKNGSSVNQSETPTYSSGSNEINRPAWIPANAYTNDQMIMEYFKLAPWLRFGQPIPAYGEDVRLFKSITCYWQRGHYGDTMVHFYPTYGHSGNFTFYTTGDASGPHGWVEDTGQVRYRRHLYRIWFDQ